MDKKEQNNHRMSLHFDKSDADQMLCYDFLNKYPKLKTKIVALIVNDFIERYNIHDISQQEMRDFIRFFTRIKNAIERTSPGMFQVTPQPATTKQAQLQFQENISSPEEPETSEDTGLTASAEEMARMDAALAMFFSDDE